MIQIDKVNLHSHLVIKLLKILLILLFPFSIMCQVSSQTLRGTVLDKSSQLPLIGANVTILESDPLIGTITDINGEYVIENVPLGRYDISASFVGYATVVNNAVVISSAENTVLDIELSVNSNLLEEMVITSNTRAVTNEAAIVSAKSFQAEELVRIPGGIDDPARMIRKFPGVTPNGDALQNKINIRGNAPRAIRWRLDDMDIYNPNHFGFLGRSGGAVTIFSQRLLTNTDFYSGAFPADYGNTIGGVFDLRFRNGSFRKRQHSVQLSILGLDIATEGPFTSEGNSSYIANYRLSTTRFVEPFLQIGGIPLYQDLSFKLHFKLPGSGSLNVFGMGGTSSTEFLPELDTLKWDEGFANYGSIASNINATVGASYVQPLGSKTYFKSIAVGTGIKYDIYSYYLQRDLITEDTSRIGVDLDYKLAWQGYVNHQFNKQHSHRSGVIITGLFSDVDYTQAYIQYRGGGGTNLVDTLRLGEGSSALIQAYSRSQFYIGSNWQINAGVHAMMLAITNQISVEPRLGVKYLIDNKSSLSAAYGLHSQMEPFFTYIIEKWDESQGRHIRHNKDLRFNKSHHFNIGYYNSISDRWQLGAEAYYQYVFDFVVGEELPISRVGGIDFSFESQKLNNGGTANNYGLELSLERSFSGGYYFMSNVSLFEANYTANDDITRNSENNAKYILNAVGGKEWQLGKKKGRLNFLNFNLSATYAGPQYFTGIDLQRSIEQGITIRELNNPNQFVQDPLLFVDVSIIYKINRKKYNSVLNIQFINLLNRRAILRPFFDRENQSLGVRRGTGLMPSISYRVTF